MPPPLPRQVGNGRRGAVCRGRFAALLLVPLLLAGCATLPRLAWDQADDTILRRANDWLDLEPRQQSRLQARLQPWLADIRRERLDEVARAVEELAERIAAGIDVADARWAENRFRTLYDRTMASFLPVLAPTLASLEPRQRAHLAARIAEENREDRERFASGRDGGRYALAERLIEQVERWTGRLDTDQRALVHARVRAFPDSTDSWLAYRERMQRELLSRLAAGASADELERFLHDWWIERDGRTPREAGDAVAFRAAVRETLVAVGRSLSPMQRAEARRRLRDRAAILRDLAASAPAG